MEYVPISYEDVVLVYIGLVKQDSPQAAAAIEQIHATFGAQAALRAALIITVFRMELKQNHWTPDVTVYDYLIREHPEAIPLLEYAIGCCLQAWGIRDLGFAHLNVDQGANTDTESRALPPTHDND